MKRRYLCLANAVMIQNPYVKRFVVHIVSLLPNLSAITPPRAVPGIVARANSVAEIQSHERLLSCLAVSTRTLQKIRFKKSEFETSCFIVLEVYP